MEKRHIPKNLRRKEKKKSAVTAALAVCLVLLVLVMPLIGAVVGRYQHQFRSDGWVKGQDFYFTSNLLDGGTHTLAPGSTEVSFTLGNHADELRFSEMNISYEVTVTADNGNKATVENNTGTLETGAVKDAVVTVSDLQAGTYTVTAVGTGGYSKTLTATIVVPQKAGKLYYYKDPSAGEYILLTVWNEGDEQGEVTIEHTGIPDNTNPNMTDWKTGEKTGKKQRVTIEPHASKVFRFFGGTVNVTGAEVKEPY